jgi:hypothetical protein
MAKRKGTKGQTAIYKNAHMIKYGVTSTPLKTGDERRCSGRGSNFCSTGGTDRVNLVTNLVISQK